MKRPTTYPAYLFLCVLLATTSCQQQPSHVNVHKYGAAAGGGSLGVHTMQGNENLWSVAKSYDVDLRDLLDINHLVAPYHIKKGDRLFIPAPHNYTAQMGDTVYTVSRLFRTTTTDIVRLNNLHAPYALKTGQVIRLPGRSVSDSDVAFVAPKDTPPITSVPVSKIESETLTPIASLTVPTTPSKQAPQTVTTTIAPPVQQPQSPPVVMKDDGRGFLRPVAGPVISGFGPKAGGLHNDGINIRTAKGASIMASKSGQVVYAGHDIEGFGNLLLIRHADGFVTAYAHLDKILAQKGAMVKRGQVVATAGTSGHVDTPQLHFEIRKGRDALDPSSFL